MLPCTVETVPDFQGFGQLVSKRLRWMTVMRAMRPWGHFGLLFTWGLPWTTLAVLFHPTLAVAATYWGLYLAFRVAITWLIGIKGLKQQGLWKKMALIPLWDATGLSDLADELHANFDSLAWCRLSVEEWTVRRSDGRSSSEFDEQN